VVEIDRYTVVDDVGRVINPMICHGQIEGALAQGIGQAVMENVAFDAESGQMLSASFMDYAMPRAADLPLHYEMDFIDVPAKTNPLGVKGVGEAGCVGAPPAIMNAILDALSPESDPPGHAGHAATRVGSDAEGEGVKLVVNGQPKEVAANENTPLLYVLRNDLGLVGSRFGCGSGQCGACFVMVDGKPMASCDLPVSFLENKLSRPSRA
jgi:ferredoxin